VCIRNKLKGLKMHIATSIWLSLSKGYSTTLQLLVSIMVIPNNSLLTTIQLVEWNTEKYIPVYCYFSLNRHFQNMVKVTEYCIQINESLKKAVTVPPSMLAWDTVHLPWNCPLFPATLRSLTNETSFETSVPSIKSSYNFSPSTTFT